MIPLMFILGQQLSGSGDGLGQVTPPGTVPSTCVSGCTTPLPVIRNSSGDVVNIGDFWTEQGGYYSGLFTLTGNEVYALILSPKAVGFIKNTTMNINATTGVLLNSSIDGKLNTTNVINYIKSNNIQDMPLFNTIYTLNTTNAGGFSDWHLPARQEFLLMLKHFKPNTLPCTNLCNNSATTNSTNLLPCHICSMPNNVTLYEAFKLNNQEAIFDANTKWVHLSSSLNATNLFTYIPNNFGYTNYITWTTYLNYIGDARLVRRVLVS